MWEGGVRGAGLLWSLLLKNPRRVAEQMMHITDWLPSLYSATGANSDADLEGIDRVDLWTALSKDEESLRREILHNIDDIEDNSALRIGKWKLVKGATYNGQWDPWYGPSGRNNTYDIKKVLSSTAELAIKNLGNLPTEREILKIPSAVTVTCGIKKSVEYKPLIKHCLFDIENDTCEQNSLADSYPSTLEELEIRLANLNETAVPLGNLPLDPEGDH